MPKVIEIKLENYTENTSFEIVEVDFDVFMLRNKDSAFNMVRC